MVVEAVEAVEAWGLGFSVGRRCSSLAFRIQRAKGSGSLPSLSGSGFHRKQCSVLVDDVKVPYDENSSL